MDDASLKAFRKIGGERLMLHARALEFRLPGSEEPMSLEAPYDKAFGKLIDQLTRRSKDSQR